MRLVKPCEHSTLINVHAAHVDVVIAIAPYRAVNGRRAVERWASVDARPCMQLPVITTCLRVYQRLHGCTVNKQRVRYPFSLLIVAHVSRGYAAVLGSVTGSVVPRRNGSVERRELMTVTQVH